jgi:hypothetical protein
MCLSTSAKELPILLGRFLHVRWRVLRECLADQRIDGFAVASSALASHNPFDFAANSSSDNWLNWNHGPKMAFVCLLHSSSRATHFCTVGGSSLRSRASPRL